MAQPVRQCIFCGQSGSSDEHIFAKWIGRTLRDELGPIPPTAKVVFCHRSAHPEAGIAMREKTAKQPAYVTRAVCESCNNGWMALLEQRVQPVLEPLIVGEPRTLAADDQELLAFWATKTVLAFQTLEVPETEWARSSDFAELYKTQEPLAHSQVWLGAHASREVGWQRAHSFEFPGQRAREGVAGFGSTLLVGRAAFYVLVGYGGRVGLRLQYDAGFALTEIWPTRGERYWPPRLRLPDNTEQGLAELIRRNSVIKGI